MLLLPCVVELIDCLSKEDLLMKMPSVEDYFIQTYFLDLLPLARQIARDHGYDEREIIEAVCKVHDKYYQFPPTLNRTAWFKKVFTEKLCEARCDFLSFESRRKTYG
jgi:hypothetical protein